MNERNLTPDGRAKFKVAKAKELKTHIKPSIKRCGSNVEDYPEFTDSQDAVQYQKRKKADGTLPNFWPKGVSLREEDRRWLNDCFKPAGWGWNFGGPDSEEGARLERLADCRGLGRERPWGTCLRAFYD